MKKVLLVLFIGLGLTSCIEDNFAPIDSVNVSPDLKITNTVGIKLQSVFVTNEVAMNVKLEKAGTATIKIFDIANRVVSKENVNVVAGDNLLKVYTNALPQSAYRIGLFDSNNNMMGITDFNKL